jgi:hypothetical protein
MEDKGGNILIQEERFLDDDLKTLCNLDYLLSNINKQGNRVCRLSRQASGFIEAIRADSKELNNGEI